MNATAAPLGRHERAPTLIARRRVLAATLGIVVASLAAQAAPAAGDRLAGVRRIAVISALGDRATIFRVGFTVFDSKGGDLPIQDWDLDTVAIRGAAELLGPRFQVVPVEYDKARLIASDAPSLYPRGNPSLRPLIQARPAGEADAYLVIRKSVWYMPYPERSALVGLGAVKDRMLSFGTPSADAAIDVDLVQAGSGKTLVSKSSSLRGDFDELSAPEDPGDWADKPDHMSPEQIDKLHANLAALIADALSRILPAMGLAEP